MFKFKRILLLMMVFLGLAVTACAAPNVEFLPTKDNVKYLGRTVFQSDAAWMCFSSTGVAFNVSAKKLEIEITGDNKANLQADDGSAARVIVLVNGERKVDEMILHQTQVFTVFSEAKVVEAQVQVIKVSESANSLAAVSKIITDSKGTISPVKDKALKIEFIGDSITCGYGVDDLNASHHFRTSTEDSTKTYAYKTAQKLDADYSFVSMSGWGVVSGYTNGPKSPQAVLPKIYDKIGHSWERTVKGKQPQIMNWDFNNFTPDVIVINLGTNDFSYTKKDEKKINEFKYAYTDFIYTIRGKNPKAHIICALGIMGDDLYPAVEAMVSEYSAKSGDTNIQTLRFTPQNTWADGVAADWHPSEKTHEKAALVLSSVIKRINN